MSGDLQTRSVFIVAEEAISEPEGEAVHRAGGRYADVPKPQAARIVLDCGRKAAAQDAHGLSLVANRGGSAGRHAAPYEVFASDDVPEPVDVGFEPGDLCAIQRAAHRGNRGRPVRSGDDQLCQQRIVVGADFRTVGYPGFDPGICRKAHLSQHAAAGAEVLIRILGVDARLDGDAARRTCRGRRASGGPGIEEGVVTGRAADHPFDQVHARNLLRHCVLDLEAGVDFQKRELIPLRVVEKLDGAR